MSAPGAREIVWSEVRCYQIECIIYKDASRLLTAVGAFEGLLEEASVGFEVAGAVGFEVVGDAEGLCEGAVVGLDVGNTGADAVVRCPS